MKPPFFEGLSVWDVLSFFAKGIYEGAVTTRAGSVSFSFFLAFFPGIIFLFTLVAYLPVQGMSDELFRLLHDMLPPSTYELAENTINDILTIKRGGLLSFTFVAAMVFATNGTLSLISNLGITYHGINVKNFWQQYFAALLLTVVLTVLLFIGIVALIFSASFTNWLVEFDYMAEYSANIISWGRILVLISVVLLGISLVYNYGPVRSREWRFISPGAILATLLMIASSSGFGFYVENFSTYNRFYGSIGTLLIMLLWIYINAVGLIIGFELNASIAGAQNKKDTKELD